MTPCSPAAASPTSSLVLRLRGDAPLEALSCGVFWGGMPSRAAPSDAPATMHSAWPGLPRLKAGVRTAGQHAVVGALHLGSNRFLLAPVDVSCCWLGPTGETGRAGSLVRVNVRARTPFTRSNRCRQVRAVGRVMSRPLHPRCWHAADGVPLWQTACATTPGQLSCVSPSRGRAPLTPAPPAGSQPLSRRGRAQGRRTLPPPPINGVPAAQIAPRQLNHAVMQNFHTMFRLLLLLVLLLPPRLPGRLLSPR